MPYVPIEAIKRYQSNPNLTPKNLENIPNYLGQPASERTARRWHLYLQQGLEDPLPPEGDDEIAESILTMVEEDQSLQVTSNSDTIKTLEQLLDACDVDLSLWKVDRWEVKSYQGYRRDEHKNLEFDKGRMSGIIIDEGNVKLATMFSVKVWFVKREEKPFEDVLDNIISRLEAAPKPIVVTRNYPKGEYLLIPSLSDVHFARLSLDGKYTPDQTLRDLDAVGNAILGRTSVVGMPVDRFLIPVGNDLLNADNTYGTTTRGTWQEMSASIRDAVDAAVQGYTGLIDKCVEFAPVDVAIVDGNHDRYGCYWMGKVLEAYYRNNKYVKIDNTKSPRKYYQYGRNLIGLEHGDRVKAKDLAMIMAQEAASIWGDTQYRTFFRGHFHKESEMFSAVTDVGGVTVVTFPAFCPPDSWELLMGYLGPNRAAGMRYFHKEQGPAAVIPIFVDELDKSN